MGRGRFRKRGLDDPEGADEALESAQRLSVAPGARYHDCAEDLRRQFEIPPAVALRRECPYVTRDVQSRHLRGCRARSEEHTSELQSLMRISYAVFCLKKKTHIHTHY